MFSPRKERSSTTYSKSGKTRALSGVYACKLWITGSRVRGDNALFWLNNKGFFTCLVEPICIKLYMAPKYMWTGLSPRLRSFAHSLYVHTPGYDIGKLEILSIFLFLETWQHIAFAGKKVTPSMRGRFYWYRYLSASSYHGLLTGTFFERNIHDLDSAYHWPRLKHAVLMVNNDMFLLSLWFLGVIRFYFGHGTESESNQ